MHRMIAAAAMIITLSGGAPQVRAQAVPGAAVAPTQLQHSVAWRLRSYGYSVDTRRLSTRQLAALHMLMIHPGRYIETRMKIRTILSWDRNGTE